MKIKAWCVWDKEIVASKIVLSDSRRFFIFSLKRDANDTATAWNNTATAWNNIRKGEIFTVKRCVITVEDK